MLGYGVDVTVDEIARRLVTQYGHSVDVWTPTTDGTFADAPYNLREIIVYGAPVNRVLPLLELNACTALRKLRRRLSAEGARYDVVVPCTHPYYGVGRVLNAPDVFFNFGNVPTAGFSWKGKLNWAWLDFSERAVHKPRARAVASISCFLHDQQSAAVRTKGRVIYLGGDHYGTADPTDAAARQASRQAARHVLGLPADAVLLGFCGRLHKQHPPYKGTQVLLDMAEWLAARQSAAKLVMCGIGSPDDEAWISGRAAIPLANLPPARMPLFYDALDVYVCASTWEGFNLPIVEAAWHGVPAVAYDAGAHREHVTAALAAAGNQDELFSEAARLAGDAALRVSLSAQAWQRAQQFSWDECARQFEQLLREVAE